MNAHTKSALRRKALDKRSALGTKEREKAADEASKHFLQDSSLEGKQTIAAYWPIKNEIDPLPLLQRLEERGHKICLPVVTGKNQPLIFRLWQRGDSLFPAGFDMMVPGDNVKTTIPDLIILPLVAFDKTGTRLGYGGGYYDRTIGAMKKSPTLTGFAFSVQELDNIERERHDVPLDIIVTEKGRIEF